MANWCNNIVIFTGSEDKIKEITNAFLELEDKSREEGVLIGSVEEYIFDIYVSQDGMFSYQTKWSPNVSDIETLAKQYGLDFNMEFTEEGCQIYGESNSIDGLVTTEVLKDECWDMFEYDDEEDIYMYDGESYEVMDEILELLFKDENNIKEIHY